MSMPHPGKRATVALVLTVAIVMMSVGSAATAGAGEIGGDVGVDYSTDFADPAMTSTEWGFTNGATTESGDGFFLGTEPGAFLVALDDAPNLRVSPDDLGLPAASDQQSQVVEVEVASLTGDPSALAGVICFSSLDDDLGYAFAIGNDGYYAIARYAGNGSTRIVNPKGTKRTDAIDPSGPNTVRAECTRVGKQRVRLALFINDEKIGSVVDRAKQLGREGFLVTEVAEGERASATYSSFAITVR